RDEADEGLVHLNEVLQIDHCQSAAYRERGSLFVTQGRTAEAIADYRKGLRYGPEDPYLHHNLGVVLATGDEALQHLKRAVELSPENAEFQHSLGSLLLARRQYDEAIRHLMIAVELNPDHAAARKHLQEARDALQRSGQ